MTTDVQRIKLFLELSGLQRGEPEAMRAVQSIASGAAVALGEQQFDKAIKHLQVLAGWLEDEEVWYAHADEYNKVGYQAAARGRANPAIHILSPKQRKRVNDLERLWLEGEAMAWLAHDIGDEEEEALWLEQAEEAQAALTAVADELEDISEEDRGERDEYEAVDGMPPTAYEMLIDFYDDWVREYIYRVHGIDKRKQGYSRWLDDPGEWFAAVRGLGKPRGKRPSDRQIANAAGEAWREWAMWRQGRRRIPHALLELEHEARAALLFR